MNNTSEFTYLCKVTELQEGKGKRFYINGCDVAVFKIKDKIFALNNICPHQKAAIIYDGTIEDGKISCPAHGWQFNMATGCYADGRKGLDVYDIQVADDKVFIKVFEREFKW